MSSVALIPNPEPARPVDWARELEGAKMLLRSGLLPVAVKSPEAAMFIILAGRDLGLSPVQSLRSINVIQGKVEVSADQQLGLFHRAGGKSQWIELTNEKAVLVLAAPWLIQPHTETFSIEDAKRAKLTGDNYQKYPKAMLRSRAITSGLKSVGFDPTAGVYDYGEIGGPEPVITVDDVTQEKINERLAAADAGNGNDNGQVKAEVGEDEPDEEHLALKEIEELLPALDDSQQAYVRHKLSNGADPVALLDKVRQKARV